MRREILNFLFDETVSQLTKKRNLNCNRVEFFTYCCIFAALLKTEYIQIKS